MVSVVRSLDGKRYALDYALDGAYQNLEMSEAEARELHGFLGKALSYGTPAAPAAEPAPKPERQWVDPSIVQGVRERMLAFTVGTGLPRAERLEEAERLTNFVLYGDVVPVSGVGTIREMTDADRNFPRPKGWLS